MRKLYEITGDLMRVEDLESEELVRAHLDSLQIEFEAKVDGVCRIITNGESEAEEIGKEIARLQARKRSAERGSQWLRDYLKTNMDVAGIPRVKTNLFGVSLSDSKPKVDVVSMNDLPKEFVKIAIETVPLKDEILAHFKATGEVPPGCSITVGKTLRIM
jgi:hypothetical protein